MDLEFCAPITSTLMNWLEARHSNQTMVRAFRQHAALQCSVMHDKIFAMIGLLSKVDQQIAIGLVDYSISTAQLLVNTLQAFPSSDQVSFARDGLCHMNITAPTAFPTALDHGLVTMYARVVKKDSTSNLNEFIPFQKQHRYINRRLAAEYTLYLDTFYICTVLDRQHPIGIIRKYSDDQAFDFPSIDQSGAFEILAKLFTAAFTDCLTLCSKTSREEEMQISFDSSWTMRLAIWDGLHRFAPQALENLQITMSNSDTETERYWKDNALQWRGLLWPDGWRSNFMQLLRGKLAASWNGL